MEERVFDFGDIRALPDLRMYTAAGLSAADIHTCRNVISPSGINSDIWPLAAMRCLIAVAKSDPLAAVDVLWTIPGLLACSVYREATDTDTRALLVLFGHHLGSLRTARGGNRVMMTDSPQVPYSLNHIAIPHFVAIRRGHTIDDVVVWEWQSSAELTKWICGRPFEPRKWYRSLDALVALRRALRQRTIDATRHRELFDHLEGRYLSFKFVAEHEELIARTLEQLSPRSDGAWAQLREHRIS